jgi:hypothetical protein
MVYHQHPSCKRRVLFYPQNLHLNTTFSLHYLYMRTVHCSCKFEKEKEIKMKKIILIVALVLATVAIVGVGAGVVFAQDVTPPFTGQGPMRNGEGPLHTFMVVEWSKKLDLNVNDINTRLAAGESMYDIALSAGVTAEEFPVMMAEVRTNAVNVAVAANVITQEQADWMLLHGQGMGGMHGTGDCTGSQGQAGSYGRGMMNGGGHGMMGGWQGQQTNP